MSYTIYRFGGTQFVPKFNRSQDIGTGRAMISAVNAPRGGSYDNLGREQAPRGGYQLKASGAMVGVSASDLKTQYDSLRSYLGKREKLFRRDAAGNLSWVWARLESVDTVREDGMPLMLQMDLTFFVFSALWAGESYGTWRFDDGYAFDDGKEFDETLIYPLTNATTTITLTNNGNGVVRALEFALTPKVNPITGVQITKTGETDMTWTGTVAVDTQLVFDFGAMSIRNNGLDAYAGLELSGANHKIDDWLKLSPGDNEIVVVRTGGDATSELAVVYYDGYV